MSSIAYSDTNLATRFLSHVRFGLQKDIPNHNRNLLEKIGDAGLWPLENLPRMAMDAITDPRVVTVALTSLAMLADSYGFYSEETSSTLNAVILLLPTIPFWALKFSSYITTVEVIGAYGLRAEGRFTNKELMENFYHKNLNT